MDLDRIDRAILRALQADGRLTIQALADRVGLSPTPCRRRVQMLEDAGAIRGYRAVVDPGAVDAPLKLYAFVKLVQRTNAHLDAFEAAVRASPEILSCELVTGVHDYLISIRLPAIEHYDAFLRRVLADIPSVAEISTSIVVATVKDPGGPVPV